MPKHSPNRHKPYVPPPPEKLTYQADGLDVTLTVARANVHTGTYRSILLYQVGEEEKKLARDLSNKSELSDYLLHTIVYPSLIAATVDAKGFHTWPLSFEDYLQLPEAFTAAWEAKVYELNPNWRVKSPEQQDAKPDEEAEKKVPSSAQE